MAQNSARSRVPVPVSFPSRTYLASRPTIISHVKSRLFLSKIQPRPGYYVSFASFTVTLFRVNLPVNAASSRPDLTNFRLFSFTSMPLLDDATHKSPIFSLLLTTLLNNARAMLVPRRIFLREEIDFSAFFTEGFAYRKISRK